MKKTIALLLSVLLCVSVLCACGGNTAANKVSLFDLKEAMLAAAAFGDMAYVSSEDQNAKTYLATVSDFDFEKVDAFSITYAKDGKGNADEIVVIRVKNPADTGDALATLQAHLKTRQSIYATYDPTQSEKIGKGVTFSKGAYAVLIVSDDNAAVKAAFDEHVK
jgi:hypothetical protein